MAHSLTSSLLSLPLRPPLSHSFSLSSRERVWSESESEWESRVVEQNEKNKGSFIL